MIVIGHRGAPFEAVENSFEAFELAVDSGADRIEFDVQLTADNELVVMHDKTLQRTCNRWGATTQVTREQFQNIRLLNNEPVPFLDEVIDRFSSRIELNIELKTDQILAAEKVAQLIHTYNIHEQVIVSSFYRSPMEYLASHHSQIPRACLWGGAFSWPDIAHLAPPVFMNIANTKVFHPWVDLVTPAVVEWAKSKNWIIYPFVSGGENKKDNEEVWDYLYALGVDGLCTNRPREMRQWLKQVKHHELKFNHPNTVMGHINV